ncbi:MAG: Yip1 family protein [Limnospira sp.]
MARAKYSLQPGSSERLVVSWDKKWWEKEPKNFTIYLDGRELGKFENTQAIKDGQYFDLNDGTQIKVRLIRDFIFWYLQILWCDRPVPGSDTDPETQLRKAYQTFLIICKIIVAFFGVLLVLSFFTIIIARDVLFFMGLSVGGGMAFIILMALFNGTFILLPYFLTGHFLKRKAKLAAYFGIVIIFGIYGYAWIAFWVSVLMSIFAVLGSLMDGLGAFIAATILLVLFNLFLRFILNLSYVALRRVWTAPIAIYQLDPKSVLNSASNPYSQCQDNVQTLTPTLSDSAILGNLPNLTKTPPSPPPPVPKPQPPKPPKPPQPRSQNNSAIAKMQTLHPEGYKLYQQAEQSRDSALFFQAGEMYDRSYSSFWGDGIFSGNYDRHFIGSLGISIEGVGMEIAKQQATKIIKNSRESLVISCECYLKTIKLDPEHYWATLKLATALTAALQIEASLTYWRQALNLDKRDTLSALTADSMGFDNRSTAAKEVMYKLGLGSSSQEFDANFIKQQAIAKKLLCANPYLLAHIPTLRTG